MTATGGLPERARLDQSFASGIQAHFDSFQTSLGNPDDVFVRITLMNQGMFYFKGLLVSHIENVPGCVMIRGKPPRSDEALVIREEHILMAEFNVDPEPIGTFGFP